MTLKQVIDYVDSIRPNDFSPDTKTIWVNEVENMIQAEVLLFAPEDMISYTYSEDSNCELLISQPYEKIYYTYLSAMVSLGLGEYDRYENEIKVFNGFYRSFCKWFTDHYDPGTPRYSVGEYQNARGIPVFLSSYGIAVKHGFPGNEEQWLRSLRGRDGKDAELDEITMEWIENNLI